MSNRIAKLTATLAGIALAAAALAGCTAATPEESAEEPAAQVAVQTTEAPKPIAESNAFHAGDELPGGCTQWSAIRWSPVEEDAPTTSVSVEGPDEFVDMGASELASGPVTLDDEGRLATYTVEAGDAPKAIGARFCVDYITLLQFNYIGTIQPGDVLSLHVDPAVPFPLEW